MLLFGIFPAGAHDQHELNSGWLCKRANEVRSSGEELSGSGEPLVGWLPATVPGTVLTTLLNNKLVPDPFIGDNNKQIPDVYKTGRDYYTYWFVNDLKEAPPAKGEHVYLYFRGVNYYYDVFLNGHKLGDKPDTGMFLTSSFDISPYLNRSGNNRLAVIVYPPDPVGDPNGGQGGDGMIAHSITSQYTAGWDWIQPIHDRNTGIWDKVFVRRSGPAHLEHTHVVTRVGGKRTVEGKQRPAYIDVTTEVENPSESATIKATVQCEIAGKKYYAPVTLEPGTLQEVSIPDIQIDDPKLWWPNGYGPQYLYPMKMTLLVDKKPVDDDEVNVGIRQIAAVWNKHTNSREIHVNGQGIFIKGGNWIVPDAMLRMNAQRYDDEVRMHRDANLNLIRVWGGGITERPEFYDACDKYGLLVMQDLWMSGDCNGRWDDPMKKEDSNTRKQYPDDHALFLASAADQIMQLRNHPSLALWCGGNEIAPPADILKPLKDSILPALDSTRFFFTFSNDDSMSLHGGDGPYVIQDDRYFWDHQSYPFNSEIGSVGLCDLESLERVIPKQNLVAPYYSQQTHKWVVDTMWQYHKYEGYDSVIERYGHAKSIKDFTMKAQLVNYNQYRALMEGASSRMWDWYTGIIIWKTQNPWSCLKGQLYDCYLDENASLYGVMAGAKPLHVFYDTKGHHVATVNNRFAPAPKMELTVKLYTPHGEELPLVKKPVQGPGTRVVGWKNLGKTPDSVCAAQGGFLYLTLTDSGTTDIIDQNFYWLPDKDGSYAALCDMPNAKVTIAAKAIAADSIEVTVSDPHGSPLAFFCRVALEDQAGKRILPAFYSNNYISVVPGQEQKIMVSYRPQPGVQPRISIEGMNVEKVYASIEASK